VAGPADASLVERLRADGHPIGAVYLSRREIAERVAELASELASAYRGRNPLLVAPLKSSAVFLADLSRALSVPHELDFVELAPYSGGDGGAVRLLKDLDASIEARDVLLVEDVVDTGLTLNFLLRTLSLREAASLAAVTLLDRPYRRLVEVPLAHVGFTVPDELFAGYGLGLDERWRALPDLHVLEADELPATVTGDGFHHGEPDSAAA
jgi:hypoxanthine phosphoribosyltransferase